MGKIKRHFCLWDIETSGLDPAKHDIVQIAARAISYHDYTLHEVGNFEVLIKPQKPENAEPKAIEVIGKDNWAKALEEGIHPKTAFKKYLEFIDSMNPTQGNWRYTTSPIMVGFNSVAFDFPFLVPKLQEYKLIDQKKDDRPWAYFQYDVAALLNTVFGRDDLKNNKLDTYCEMFGIKRSGAYHGAAEDVDLTTQLFVKYMRFMGRIRPMIAIQKIEEPVNV